VAALQQRSIVFAMLLKCVLLYLLLRNQLVTDEWVGGPE
jgi:hypothetical protein